MNIRSLLLGSVAAAGLSTAGFAADLGVVTSLDVCDELGISGLTISSDDNCLVIDGGVSMEYSIGDYLPSQNITDLDIVGGVNHNDVNVADAGGVIDSSLDIDTWLRFVATADSDFGPAKATIKLMHESQSFTADATVFLDEAFVSVGDTTVIMAGHKGSIFKDGDDAPLNYLGLFNSSKVDVGVGFFKPAAPGVAGAATGGNVIQIVSNLGNGISIGGGIENLQTSVAGVPAPITGVGVISYAGDGLSAHASFAVDQNSDWKVHSGFAGSWDPVKVVAAVAADSTGWWNALGSVSATFDMFTLAASGEATAGGEWGVGGSISATVSEGVTVNLGSRWFDDNAGPGGAWQVEGGVSAAVTETITLTAAVGAIDGVASPTIIYGKAGVAWAPGGGFTSSLDGYVNSDGGYKATFKAAKTIK